MPFSGIGSAIVGGIFNKNSQSAANKANARQAEAQMAFQERMSNTAYQRSMDDLSQAGLNPALAYQQGGASSPGGASAQMGSEDGIGDAISGLATTALDMKMKKKQAKMLKLKLGQETQAFNKGQDKEDANINLIKAQTTAIKKDPMMMMSPVFEKMGKAIKNQVNESQQNSTIKNVTIPMM